MTHLTSEPPAPVRSLDELLAIAYALEHEAAEHYTAFATQARRENLPDLADLFEKLAAEERHHEHYVQAWAQQHSGKAPDIAAIRWDLPETFDLAGGTELASSRLATAYRILAVAVQNEDRAFALWSYIAAHADAGAIREAAETMARQELQHAWDLRRARRQAYHAEGLDKTPRAGAKTLAGLGRVELRLARHLEQATAGAQGGTAQELQRLALESRQMAAQSDGTYLAEDEASSEEDILTMAERLAEDYLDIGDHSANEAEIAQAQALAARAVMRLAQLRALGNALPGGRSAA
ncbi:ferritin family protein [Ferrovibrio sp.]|uniref:ferritin-like domain-containing protein n=1 Tax=Ferrovibrio sp. TaxID=1917215 RepID=UPI00260E22B2|nr:ferritin family protein [Ferrovibrio sp.]